MLNGPLVSQALQVALTLAAVVAFALLYRRSRTAGLAFMWASWLFIPFVRRLLDWGVGNTERDILSLAPFVLTALAGLLALRRAVPAHRGLVIPALAGLALLVGVPAGLAQPAALAFALLSYGAVLLALFIGHADAREADDHPLGTLGRTLLATMPVIAIYGIGQYYLLRSIPWDIYWVETSGIRSLLSPEPDYLRVFSTLNSPLPAAAVLGVALLVWIAASWRGLFPFANGILGSIALALTYVRSVWLGIAAGGLVYLLASRSRAALQKTLVTAAVAVAIFAVGWSFPTVQAVIRRALSLTTLETDVSAQDRFELIDKVAPAATSLDTPLGHGLGQAGLASDLGGESPLASADNGYLAILYQTGPLGFALMMLVLGILVLLAIRGLRRGGRGTALELALLAYFLVLEFFNDTLYGVRGAMLWYAAGRILAYSLAPQAAGLPIRRPAWMAGLRGGRRSRDLPGTTPGS